MKRILATLLFLATPALGSAQNSCGNLAGVVTTVIPSTAAPGQPIMVRIENNRIEIVFSDAAGSAFSSATLSSSEGLCAGDLRMYQFWYRDNTGPCATGFSVSSAYRIQW